MLYVFVVIHHGSRRLVHFNVTEHPTSGWTLQQLREAGGYEACYRDLIIRHGIDEKHGLDVTLAGGYWYWVAATGVILYVVVFWSPRWIGGAA